MRTWGRRFDAIESQAAGWLVRRDRGMTAREESDFQRWCSADPRHAAAVSEIEAVWGAFDGPAANGQTEILRAELRALTNRDRRRWMARSAGVGMLAAAACIAVMLWPREPVTADAAPRAATAIITTTARVNGPERRTLPDGSTVELRDGAEIAVAFQANLRRVILKIGEAHFSVTKDRHRPFVVEAGAVQVRAVGTAFAVQLGQGNVEVLVTEGTVSVVPPPAASRAPSTPTTPAIAPSAVVASGAAPLVTVGQRAVIPLGGAAAAVEAVPPTELAERLSWRLPRLDFSETTLAEACALFNQHNELKLRVAGDSVASLRITGVFRSDNIQGFVGALESSLGVHAERDEREIVLR